MLPKTLTESQECIPDLTDKQLEALCLESNFCWKLNAKMVGYTEGTDLDSFIDTVMDRNIKTFKKDKHVAVFLFEGTKESTNDFPIAIEGDYVIQQKYELTNGAWKELDVFLYRPELNCILGTLLASGLTGNFKVLYVKSLEASCKPSKSKDSTEFYESLENINNTLKDIDLREKEQKFIKTNNLHKSKNIGNKSEEIQKKKDEIRYRITK